MSSPATPAPERGEFPIEKMLQAMEELKASDLFVCEGKTPAIRQHGSLLPLRAAATTAAPSRPPATSRK